MAWVSAGACLPQARLLATGLLLVLRDGVWVPFDADEDMLWREEAFW